MMTKLLNVNEVAEILGLKPARVYQMTRDKCLPFVLIGERQYRYNPAAIEIYIRRGGNQDTPNIEGNDNE
jgi:excisionase family DNA binding protein